MSVLDFKRRESFVNFKHFYKNPLNEQRVLHLTCKEINKLEIRHKYIKNNKLENLHYLIRQIIKIVVNYNRKYKVNQKCIGDITVKANQV